jgi:hypothetical protein
MTDKPWGVPSGGDWGLYRGGAVFFEGTQNCMVQHCTFERLDGNAVFVSGWNRNTTIADNEFSWLGASAAAGTVRVFRQKSTLEDAIEFHAFALRLKLLQACDQWHSSRLSTFLTGSHCKFRPNTEGWGYTKENDGMDGQQYGVHFWTGFFTR